jgi:hypothetical protein
MKFELAGGTVNALEELEENEGLKVNSSQIAFVYSCHISSTVGGANSGLQNEGGFVGDQDLARASGLLHLRRTKRLSSGAFSRSGSLQCAVITTRE